MVAVSGWSRFGLAAPTRQPMSVGLLILRYFQCNIYIVVKKIHFYIYMHLVQSLVNTDDHKNIHEQNYEQNYERTSDKQTPHHLCRWMLNRPWVL